MVIALLATEGVHPGKHTTVRAFLNKNWIKTGKLSKETGRLFNMLFDRREKGDYGDYFRFNTVRFLNKNFTKFYPQITLVPSSEEV